MGVVLMLMTIGGLLIAVILLAVSYFMNLIWLRNFVFGGVAVWLAGYVILLFTSSIFSEEKTLDLNEPKEYCGLYLDCHIHTSVTAVRKTKTIGLKTADGIFYVVKVKVLSDAKKATLGLIAVDAKVYDAEGKAFARDAEAEAGLGEQPPFETRISPLESFEKEIVFDLPDEVNGPRLDIRDGYGIDHLIEAVLIGDEDSILHKRKFFKLESEVSMARATQKGTVRDEANYAVLG